MHNVQAQCKINCELWSMSLLRLFGRCLARMILLVRNSYSQQFIHWAIKFTKKKKRLNKVSSINKSFGLAFCCVCVWVRARVVFFFLCSRWHGFVCISALMLFSLQRNCHVWTVVLRPKWRRRMGQAEAFSFIGSHNGCHSTHSSVVQIVYCGL